jgi:hypothetical protein
MRSSAIWVCLAFVACGDSGEEPTSSTGAGGQSSGGQAQGAAGGSSTGAGSTGGGGAGQGGNASTGGNGTGGEFAALPTCLLSCVAVSDCATPNALTDEDNWACDADLCEYLGCQSTEECQVALSSGDYVCENIGGPTSTCVHTCAQASDCATNSALTDADNWSCEGQRCKYVGCQSTNECQQVYANPDYVCETAPGVPIPQCLHTCATSADCATPSAVTDADNWSCDQNRCLYLGCQGNPECQEAYANPDYVCVE